MSQKQLIVYDIDLFNTIYQTLLTVNNGYNLSNNGSWTLLLNKVMKIVGDIPRLDKVTKIALTVDLVIKYLDEKTDISDYALVHIKSSVEVMCMSMLGFSGELSNVKPVKLPADPELIATPLQISALLKTKIKELLKQNSAGNSQITFQTLVNSFTPIVMLCITTVNKFQNLSGLEKRNVIETVITTFLTNEIHELVPSIASNSDQQIALTLFQNDLHYMIDLFVGIAKNKTDYKFDFKDPATRACLGTCLLRGLSYIILLCRQRRNNTPDTAHLLQVTTTGNPAITTGNPAITTGNPAITTGNPAITTGNPAITTGNPATTSIDETSHKVDETSHKVDETDHSMLYSVLSTESAQYEDDIINIGSVIDVIPDENNISSDELPSIPESAESDESAVYCDELPSIPESDESNV